jgi:hypothetical protein
MGAGGAMMGGAMLGGAMEYGAIQDQAAALRGDAVALEKQAAFIQNMISRTEDVYRRKMSDLEGEQISAYAKAGVDLSGSALEVILDSQSELRMEMFMEQEKLRMEVQMTMTIC